MTWSGSEQVAGRIAEALDAETVFTFAAVPEVTERAFPGRQVVTSRVGRTVLARRHWPWLLPVMSEWWRRLDLSAYDVVVTVSHSTVNSIRVRPDAVHVSYCCTPMRYAWTWREELGRIPRALRPAWPAIAALLRRGDRKRATNVDAFMAVSREVASRIERWYGRESMVVYPSVDSSFFVPEPLFPRGDFFLFAGRLVAYKRPDVAIEAARRAGVRLVVAGSGPELERLRRGGTENVDFVVGPTSEQLRDLYRRARALVVPGVEDFGIVMVEAQLCGCPVIARDRGGAPEAVVEGETGVLYGGESPERLSEVLRNFDGTRFEDSAIRQRATALAENHFEERVRMVVTDAARRRNSKRLLLH